MAAQEGQRKNLCVVTAKERETKARGDLADSLAGSAAFLQAVLQQYGASEVCLWLLPELCLLL